MTARAPGALLFSVLLHGAVVAVTVTLLVRATIPKQANVAQRIRVCLAVPVASPPVVPKRPAVEPVMKQTRLSVEKPTKKVYKVPTMHARQLKKRAVKKTAVAKRPVSPPAGRIERRRDVAVAKTPTVPKPTGTPRHADVRPRPVIAGKTTGAPSQTQSEYLDAHLSQIVQLLQENLYYPRMARKRRIEGKVVVSFVVEKDGSVHNLTIKKHCRPVLDHAALETVESLSGKLPHPKNRLELDVPIRFVLR